MEKFWYGTFMNDAKKREIMQKKKEKNIIENKRTKQKCNREKKYVLIMNSIDIIFGCNIHISYG